mmetsp:Transcript_47767/g.107628  ORF Transcript_47767/g.107628 Transcript_47767/m.107628 type:complete len:304 (-) Transcript_47767:554-1465(-)
MMGAWDMLSWDHRIRDAWRSATSHEQDKEGLPRLAALRVLAPTTTAVDARYSATASSIPPKPLPPSGPPFALSSAWMLLLRTEVAISLRRVAKSATLGAAGFGCCACASDLSAQSARSLNRALRLRLSTSVIFVRRSILCNSLKVISPDRSTSNALKSSLNSDSGATTPNASTPLTNSASVTLPPPSASQVVNSSITRLACSTRASPSCLFGDELSALEPLSRSGTPSPLARVLPRSMPTRCIAASVALRSATRSWPTVTKADRLASISAKRSSICRSSIRAPICCSTARNSLLFSCLSSGAS